MNPNLIFDFIADKDNHTLTITREFAATRDLVWDCYTKRELVEQWFAPKPLVAKTKSMNFTKGGHWHYAMVEPNGTEYWGYTEYTDIQPIEYYASLDAFCNAAGEINKDLPRAAWTVHFKDHGQHTIVETKVQYHSLSDLETVLQMGMEEGMRSTLERLDELIENLNNKRLPNGLYFDFSINESNNTILAKREFAADLQLVWKAWTTAELLDQWWAPKPYQCNTKSMQFKEGGRWHYYMQGPTGDIHWCLLDYEKIEIYKYYTGSDAFCDEYGVKNETKPFVKWHIRFDPYQSEHTVVDMTLYFESVEDIHKIIQMGFKEGFAMGMSNLDEMIASKSIN